MARWTLWYDTPVADWEREALPIGNGTLGAMVFGGVARERIQFNEKSLWTGGPGPGGYDHGNWRELRPGALAAVQRLIDEHGAAAPGDVAVRLGQPRSRYGVYQPFGDLWLDIPDVPETLDSYRRRLEISQGVALVEYTAHGGRHQREFFASYPDRVIVGRLSAAPWDVGFTLRHISPRPGDHQVTAHDGRWTIRGALADNGLRFEAQVRVVCDGGTVTAGEDGTLTVTGARSAWFVLAAGTDYADTHPHYRGEDPHRAVTETVDAAADRGHLTPLSRHVRDHRALFDRTALDLGGRTPPLTPTDRQRAAYPGGESPADRARKVNFWPGCATATAPTGCSPDSWRIPPSPTCGTPTRRSRSTATPAPPPGSPRCCPRATAPCWTFSPPCRAAGRTAQCAGCAPTATSRSTSPGARGAPVPSPSRRDTTDRSGYAAICSRGRTPPMTTPRAARRPYATTPATGTPVRSRSRPAAATPTGSRSGPDPPAPAHRPERRTRTSAARTNATRCPNWIW